MTMQLFPWTAVFVFQLTSSRRGWQPYPPLLLSSKIFPLTSSRRGWLSVICNCISDNYFNSHPHEEDDHHRQHSSKDGSISTHILTKRMTRMPVSFLRWKRYFNSHPHEEDDHITHTAVIRSGISTHILTKRMTWFTHCLIPPYFNFNSHPHEEDDTIFFFLLYVFIVFQLTSSRRGWLNT